ncbi:MAG: hypothetical protein AB7E55_18725 [Pigmentiphaga sp.]
MKNREERGARVSDRLSQDPRNPRKLAAKADLRRETDAWSLLVWAYRTECVRCVGGLDDERQLGYATSSVWSIDLLRGQDEHRRTTINGWLAVHEDALAVHGWVRRLAREDYWLVVEHAEKGELPSRIVKLPPLCIRPVMRMTSAGEKPKVVYDVVSKRASFCPLEYSGYTACEIEASYAQADARVDRLGELLQAMADECADGTVDLCKWRVVAPWRGFAGNTKIAA